MGFMDKIKDIMNVQEDDVYDEDEVDFSNDYDDQYNRDIDRDVSASSERESRNSGDKRNKYVNIHATTQLQVVLVKPESFHDATSIADHLNNKRTVVLNLESTNKDISRRLVDFLSGVAYANRGQLKRVANSTFIITPFNVDIMGDLLLDELENSGLYM